jgi:hypothetical protein
VTITIDRPVEVEKETITVPLPEQVDPFRQRRALWVKALRSGKYRQAQGRLRTDGGFCCLGVACEVAIADGVDVRRGGDVRAFTYDGAETALPPSVAGWLGGLLDNPVVPMRHLPAQAQAAVRRGPFGNSDVRTAISLAELNDAGVPFTDIADIIERSLL